MDDVKASRDLAAEKRRLAEETCDRFETSNDWEVLIESALDAYAALVSQEKDEERGEIIAALDEVAPCSDPKTLPQRVRDEMADFMMVIDNCSKAYYYITDGLISKPNTLWSEVEAVGDDAQNENFRIWMRDELEPAGCLENQVEPGEWACQRVAAQDAEIARLRKALKVINKWVISALEAAERRNGELEQALSDTTDELTATQLTIEVLRPGAQNYNRTLARAERAEVEVVLLGHDKDGLEDKVRALEAERGEHSCGGGWIDELRTRAEQAESALSTWRSWAQFVYLGGGPVTKSDDEPQTAVCTKHDEDVDAVKSALSAAQQERDGLIRDAAKFCGDNERLQKHAADLERENERLKAALAGIMAYVKDNAVRADNPFRQDAIDRARLILQETP